MNSSEKLELLCQKLFNGKKADMARELEMSPQSLNTYISGKNSPGTTILIKLAYKGVNINWFLIDRGEMMFIIDNPDQEFIRIKEENKRLRDAISSIRLVAETMPEYK